MIWRALAIAAALAAGSARAETIVARSGEHDGFSRLVMRLPDGAQWSLAQTGQNAALTVEADGVVFDTSQVFNLIPRTRLQRVRQTAPGKPLQLELGCKCEVNSYLQSDGYLVIDIRDGTPQPEYSFESSVLPLGRAALGSGYSFDLPQGAADARMALDAAADAAGLRLQERLVQPQALPEPQPAHAAILDQAGSAAQPLPENPLEAGSDAVPEEKPALASAEQLDLAEGETVSSEVLIDLEETARAARVSASEERLLLQIGRAANQGLLDLAPADLAGASKLLDPLGAQGRPLDPLAHMSVTTAIDRETGLVAQRPEEAAHAGHCLSGSMLAIYDWGGEGPFADQIGRQRAALVREFDDVSPADALSLAKTYLYFGFGAEAQAALNLLPDGRLSEEQASAYDEMAMVLDGRSMPINHAFAGQQICDGDAAFWAALADGAIKKSANTDAIQQTMAKLPVHLRAHLGPKISTLFADAGEYHMAEAALRSVDRTGIGEVPEINLAEAAIAELKGDTETVAAELTDEIAERTHNAPRALIELIGLSYKERKALPPDVPDLAASYELESRDTELGPALRRAEVAALALTGQFHQAFDELEELTERDGPAARAEALEPLMMLLAERASDVTFLQYALVFSGTATVAEAAPVADTMARRLLDLGFAEQALSVLKKLSLEPGNEGRRLMMAEAALALDKPHRALVELMGLEGSEANRLRARALWRNGEFGRAGEYLLAEKETDAAARGFWHSEDLAAIGALDAEEPSQYRQVAGLTESIGQTATDPEGLPPLAHARALVETSAGTRDGIQALLRKLSGHTDITESGD
ncbi:hypothetical protein ACUXV3_14595 [Roseobacteraceae bacterium NS-SX3]